MGLKRFDYKLPGQRKNFKQIAIVLCICLIAVLSFTSYALYEVRHPNDLVDSKVGEFNTSDVSITVLVDGVKSDAFPAKDSGKAFEKLECTNGGSASWDKENWKLSIKDISGPTECTVSFGTLYADASGAEVPELNNGMIPVTYDTATSKWIKADTSSKWYDYDTQWWANAVTVKETGTKTRSEYALAAADSEIEMDDIETMWVWIPRYEYQHTNLGDQYAGGSQTEPGAITINFISKETATASSSNYTIHDAFWWDDNNNGVKDTEEQLSGIWVAKFEMSTGSIVCTAGSTAGSGCDLTTISPQIKPNVTSWRGARIGTFWTAIHNNMNGTANQYGLTNTDAHLMKNMEWGAIAYLSQSKYGKKGNTIYTIEADREVVINNCSNFITGIGGNTVSEYESSVSCTTNTYETTKGQASSTTGNIYGIYDMNGGVSEHVMGVMKVNGSDEPAVGQSSSSNSGWSGKLYNGTVYTGAYDQLKEIGSKYYDLYEYGTDSTDYTRGHLGDATKEVPKWYSDAVYLVSSGSVFFHRGGFYRFQSSAGVFYSGNSSGYANPSNGGRPVVVHQAS